MHTVTSLESTAVMPRPIKGYAVIEVGFIDHEIDLHLEYFEENTHLALINYRFVLVQKWKKSEPVFLIAAT